MKRSKNINLFVYCFICLIIYACDNSGGSDSPQVIIQDPSIDNNPNNIINTAPVANAGLDKTLIIGERVILDGSGSLDIDNNKLIYSWSLTHKPENSSASLDNPLSSLSSFTGDIEGNYIIELIVDDGFLTHIDSIVIKIVTEIVEEIEEEITEIIPTEVQGIISEDTVWSLEGSPYILIDTVQLAFGSTLTIEPGVEILGDGEELQIFGVLNAIGEANKIILIDQLNILPGSGQEDEPFEINIEYAEMIYGSVYESVSNQGRGSLSLRNSILKNNYEKIYLLYPSKDCFIKNNIFIGSSGIITITGDSIQINIINNVFYDWYAFAIKNENSGGSSQTTIKYNSFILNEENNNIKEALILPEGYDTAYLDASSNYWGTTDTDIIESMIFDLNNHLGSNDYIDYSDYLLEPHEDTPDITPYLPSKE